MRSRAARVIIRLLAVAVSAAGMWISYELTRDHLEIAGEHEKEGFLDEVCVAFEHSSCEEVSESPWGVFPFGASEDEAYVPTALLGLFYFTAVFCWFVLIGGCTVSRWWAHLIPAAGTAIGLGSSVYLDYVMWAHLEHWCPLCLATHIASLLLFVFAILLWPRRPKPAKVAEAAVRPAPTGPWPHGWMLLVTPIVALLAIGVEFLYLARTMAPGGLTPEAKELRKKLETANYYKKRYRKHWERYNKNWHHTYLAWQLSPPIHIPIEQEPFRGPANARHTVVIYSDFQCPSCKRFEEWFMRTIFPTGRSRSVGGIKVIFKHWPICTDCNDQAAANRHPVACKAARAAEAARIVGGDATFWKMYDLLWERQNEWKKSQSFVELAREIGLDEEAFAKAMDSDEAMARIRAHVAEGVALGNDLVEKKVITEEEREWIKVNSTPSVYVDNKRLSTWTHANTWNKIVGYTRSRRTSRSTSSRPTATPIAATRPADGRGAPSR